MCIRDRHKDLELREHLMDRLKAAGISRVVIERPAGRARVTIYAGRPGLIIGKKGQDIEKLRVDLSKMAKTEVSLNIVEVRKPEIDAKLVGENIAQQLERRVGFRRAMKRAVQSAMRLGAQGVLHGGPLGCPVRCQVVQEVQPPANPPVVPRGPNLQGCRRRLHQHHPYGAPQAAAGPPRAALRGDA